MPEPFDPAAADFVARFCKQIDEATNEVIAEANAAAADLRASNRQVLEYITGGSGLADEPAPG